VQQLYEAMKAEAIAAGEKLIESERALDQEFAAQKMTEARLTLLAAQVGERQGALRAVHLKYHLSTAELFGSTGNGTSPMFNGRRQPSCGGTSRISREAYVRICERLGVKFPGPTRQSRRRRVDNHGSCRLPINLSRLALSARCVPGHHRVVSATTSVGSHCIGQPSRGEL
jgi:hypothetical protein